MNPTATAGKKLSRIYISYGENHQTPHLPKTNKVTLSLKETTTATRATHQQEQEHQVAVPDTSLKYAQATMVAGRLLEKLMETSIKLFLGETTVNQLVHALGVEVIN